MYYIKKSRMATVAATLLALTACSGDGSSGDNSTANNVPDNSDGPAMDQMDGDAMNDPSMSPSFGNEVEVNTDQDPLDNMGMQPIGGGNNTVQQNEDLGDLVPRIFETQTGIDLRFAQFGATVVEFFNDSLILPRDIQVQFVDCGIANAAYTPDGSDFGFPGPNILLCNELTSDFLNFYGDPNLTEFAMTFVFIHELGHALVDQLNLPVLGIEESYVDGLAAVFAGEGGLAEAPLVAGFYFQSQGETPFTDSHRANAQRFGDLACWAIGAEPELANDPKVMRFATQLVEAGRDCAAEYQQQLDGLTQVLNPHIKGGLGDALSNIDVDFDFDTEGNTPPPADDDPASSTLREGIWNFTTRAGDILYLVVIPTGMNRGAYVFDYQGDRFGTGQECYRIFPVAESLDRFEINAEGLLTLDGRVVGNLLTEEPPELVICDAQPTVLAAGELDVIRAAMTAQ